MKSFFKMALLGVAASAMSFGAITCGGAATTDVLTMSGGACEFNGLLFSNFSVVPTASYTAATIGITSATLQGGNTILLGFSIGGIQPAGDLTGDIQLSYKVTGVTDGVDFLLQGTPQNGISFSEKVCTVAFTNGVCAGGTTLANYGNSGGAVIDGFVSYAPTAVVYIYKDIQFNGATLSEFTNSHHVPVPEPASMALVGGGLVGLGLLSRRRSSK